MNKGFKIVSISLIVVVLGAFISFIIYDSYNTKKINESLKQDLYEAKNEIDQLRKDKNSARAEADEWFNNYIELGIQCGANE
jgi:hypothetical protein